MDKAPETMDELYQFSKEFTKGDQYGFLALWDNFYFAHGVIAGMGGYVFKNNNGALDRNDIGLNNEGAVKGTEYIQNGIKSCSRKVLSVKTAVQRWTVYLTKEKQRLS